MAIILWNKKYTETLAETLKRFRIEEPNFSNEKVTYAGRLDPMAEGLLPLLTGEDVYKKNQFLGLDKKYRIDFIFGPCTDTYDILGICQKNSQKIILPPVKKTTQELKKMIGDRKQKYPPYSSKPVQGKPLFMWAREGLIDSISIPEKNVSIYNIENFSTIDVYFEIFKKSLIENIDSVVGDFRQKEIIESWKKYFESVNSEKISVCSVEISASSGTYMRSIIHELGKKLDTQACTVKIKRIKIGNYHI